MTLSVPKQLFSRLSENDSRLAPAGVRGQQVQLQPDRRPRLPRGTAISAAGDCLRRAGFAAHA